MSRGNIARIAHVSNLNGEIFIDNVHSQIQIMQDLGLEVEVLHSVCEVAFSAVIIGREIPGRTYVDKKRKTDEQ